MLLLQPRLFRQRLRARDRLLYRNLSGRILVQWTSSSKHLQYRYVRACGCGALLALPQRDVRQHGRPHNGCLHGLLRICACWVRVLGTWRLVGWSHATCSLPSWLLLPDDVFRSPLRSGLLHMLLDRIAGSE